MKRKVTAKSKGVTFTVSPHRDCMGYSVSTEGKTPRTMRHARVKKLYTIRCYYPAHFVHDRCGPRQQLRMIRHWYRRKGWA